MPSSTAGLEERKSYHKSLSPGKDPNFKYGLYQMCINFISLQIWKILSWEQSIFGDSALTYDREWSDFLQTPREVPQTLQGSTEVWKSESVPITDSHVQRQLLPFLFASNPGLYIYLEIQRSWPVGFQKLDLRNPWTMLGCQRTEIYKYGELISPRLAWSCSPHTCNKPTPPPPPPHSCFINFVHAQGRQISYH